VCGSKLDTFTVELCVSEDRKYMNMLAFISKAVLSLQLLPFYTLF